MSNDRTVSRRAVVRGAAAGIAAIGLTRAGLGTAVAAQDKVAISWWEHFPEGLNKSVRDAYTGAHPNVEIKLTTFSPDQMVQALQLAYQSGQLPDITTAVGGVASSTQALVQAGWFQPLTNGDQLMAALPAGSVFDGLTMFNGKLYSFPIFSSRQYATLTWYNKDLLGKADVDPNSLATWDGVRAAAQAVTKKGGGSFGWIQGINFPDRIAQHVGELAQMAGSPGVTDPATGAYTYGSDHWVRALEFLLAMQRDGSLFPASVTLNAINARARWATNGGAIFFDGPWNVGVVNQDFQAFLDKVGVMPIPTPDPATPTFVHTGPPGGTFWVTATSGHPDIASDILSLMTQPDYFVNLANRMDQPPLNLDVVAQSDAHETYKQAVVAFQQGVKLGPSSIVRNPNVAEVNAEMQQITPDIGQILVGAMTGDVKDYAGAMKQYNDQITAERERAIGVVNGKGKAVSLDDWVFPDWNPAEDYVTTPATSAGGTPAATPEATPAS